MKLYSKIYGDKGQDLVIIHGLFGMSDNWNSLGKKFAKNLKVHLIDLRNHGRSPHSIDFNYDVLCEDVLEYMQDNNISKPILLGHSLGGKVAMKIAFTNPSKIERLIIVDIAPKNYNSNFHKNILAILYKLPLEDFKKREVIDNLLSETFEDNGMRLFLLKNLYRTKQKEFAWRFNIEVLLEKVCNIEDADFIEGICDVPAYFIKGGDSNYITIKDEVIIKNHFSDFSIISIANTGHWIHAENPQCFYDEVIRILSN
tara:strand:+ start:12 stop:782 length:771 start_codon:yes stop_codon:yes gene_type:complete